MENRQERKWKNKVSALRRGFRACTGEIVADQPRICIVPHLHLRQHTALVISVGWRFMSAHRLLSLLIKCKYVVRYSRNRINSHNFIWTINTSRQRDYTFAIFLYLFFFILHSVSLLTDVNNVYFYFRCAKNRFSRVYKIKCTYTKYLFVKS